MSLNTEEPNSYQLPPDSILKLADYLRVPQVTVDSTKKFILFSYRNTYKTLEDLIQPEVSLAGLRVNPVINISSSVSYISNLKIRKVFDKVPIQIKGLPSNPKIANLTWSPDESKVAFTHTTSEGIELWMMDFEAAQAQQLTAAKLNGNLGNPINWFRDNKRVLVRMLPENRPELIDDKKVTPIGPSISMSDGSKAQNRTYQDLLKSPTDEKNFEILTTSELFEVDLNGNISFFKKADIYVSENFSPDGNYLLITTIQKPFSYLVPIYRFPQLQQVFDNKGNLITEVNKVPLSEVLPKGFMAIRKGRRMMNWRSDVPSTLFYVEALDEGDPQNEVPFRDAVYALEYPYNVTPQLLIKSELRFSNIIWGNETTAILQDEWYDTRQTKAYLFNPSKPELQPRIITDRNFQDLYADPGDFETGKNEYGKYVLTIHDNCFFRIGDGFTPEGQFPFIDQQNINTLETKRVYQSNYQDKMEEFFDIIDAEKGEVLIRIQSKNEYPNYYIRNLYSSEAPIQLTHFENPFESIKNVYKEKIKYLREDGVELSGTLYLPEGYDREKATKKLPLLIWAYPAEYKDKNSAGQSTANPNEFTYPDYGSFLYWVTRGYAVLDDATFPIVGEGDKEPNDNFVEQLIANAKAAIQAVDQLGYIDPSKVAIGGHSYGAFMTANLLTHCDLFACGIARSGAYNRTLTPFGFQTEQRNYWEARDIYDAMSPYMHADKMKTPILLIHGEADNNPGTFTLQTERYFQALKGLGAPTRMVILPREQHGYMARENIFHLLWEQDTFLEKYLKKDSN